MMADEDWDGAFSKMAEGLSNMPDYWPESLEADPKVVEELALMELADALERCYGVVIDMAEVMGDD
jgi:hypothetical protein